jgi:hypothetical protein
LCKKEGKIASKLKFVNVPSISGFGELDLFLKNEPTLLALYIKIKIKISVRKRITIYNRRKKKKKKKTFGIEGARVIVVNRKRVFVIF